MNSWGSSAIPEILWLTEVRSKDRTTAGGKGASLGELANAGLPVPPAFIVSAQAYARLLEDASLRDAVSAELQGLDPDDLPQAEEVTARVQKLILGASVPPGLDAAIRAAYGQLGGEDVAVRSSATAEDLAGASFAGQQSTLLNVRGDAAVAEAVKACWASLYEARALLYRTRLGFDHMDVTMAVVVQHMVQSDVSGVLFTADPVTGDRTKVVIEAALGLGEAVVSGLVTPDLYVVDKTTLAVEQREISLQGMKVARASDGTGQRTVEVHISQAEGSRQKLSDAAILELARLGCRIEEHYGAPQDIEWAVEGGTAYILQARPITTL